VVAGREDPRVDVVDDLVLGQAVVARADLPNGAKFFSLRRGTGLDHGKLG
jgi:hypothetical protein